MSTTTPIWPAPSCNEPDDPSSVEYIRDSLAENAETLFVEEGPVELEVAETGCNGTFRPISILKDREVHLISLVAPIRDRSRLLAERSGNRRIPHSKRRLTQSRYSA